MRSENGFFFKSRDIGRLSAYKELINMLPRYKYTPVRTALYNHSVILR